MLYVEIKRFVIKRAEVNIVVKVLHSKTVAKMTGNRGLEVVKSCSSPVAGMPIGVEVAAMAISIFF